MLRGPTGGEDTKDRGSSAATPLQEGPRGGEKEKGTDACGAFAPHAKRAFARGHR